jgi:ATP-dependent RNA helicase DeaD
VHIAAAPPAHATHPAHGAAAHAAAAHAAAQAAAAQATTAQATAAHPAPTAATERPTPPDGEHSASVDRSTPPTRAERSEPFAGARTAGRDRHTGAERPARADRAMRAERHIEVERHARTERPDRPVRPIRPTRPERPAQDDARNLVWFTINVGRSKNADPKWLIPLLCRRGGISKNAIGKIQILARETRVEIARDVSERFAAAVREPDTKDRNIHIEPVDSFAV